MSINHFLQGVGYELQEILWEDVPRRTSSEELDQLERQLHRFSIALTQQRTSMDELRGRLAEKERRAQWLAARVEVYLHVADQANAWRHALELDRLRLTLDRDRARLQRERHSYHKQLALVRHLQEQLAGLQAEMYSKG